MNSAQRTSKQPAPLAPMNIGAVAELTGMSPRMVRHYEARGMLPRLARTEGGYRLYTESDVHTLHFIRRARDLGFPLEEITELLALWHNRRRASGNVRKLAQKHSAELATRIEAMSAMKRTLDHLIHCCQGDDRPDCPILDDLAGSSPGHP